MRLPAEKMISGKKKDEISMRNDDIPRLALTGYAGIFLCIFQENAVACGLKTDL